MCGWMCGRMLHQRALKRQQKLRIMDTSNALPPPACRPSNQFVSVTSGLKPHSCRRVWIVCFGREWRVESGTDWILDKYFGLPCWLAGWTSTLGVVRAIQCESLPCISLTPYLRSVVLLSLVTCVDAICAKICYMVV
eukprot:scaffold253333_cov28-Tisochrysis_lutea.AAC.3